MRRRLNQVFSLEERHWLKEIGDLVLYCILQASVNLSGVVYIGKERRDYCLI